MVCEVTATRVLTALAALVILGVLGCVSLALDARQKDEQHRAGLAMFVMALSIIVGMGYMALLCCVIRPMLPRAPNRETRRNANMQRLSVRRSVVS